MHIHENTYHRIVWVEHGNSWDGGHGVRVTGYSSRTTFGISQFIPFFKESNVIRLLSRIDENQD